MSELTRDAVEKLARFTPAGGLDAAEVMFAAGRASARTPWGWKAAVAVLLLANAGWLAGFSHRGTKPISPELPALKTQPTPAPIETISPRPNESLSPWSLGALQRTGDLESLPELPALANLPPSEPPLTPHALGLLD